MNEVGKERWTLASLKDYLVAIIHANDERYAQRFLDSQTAVQAALSAARTAVDAALSAAKEAVAKAEAASEKRFEGVNEFRGTLADQQRTLMPRSEQESINHSLFDKLAQHEKRFDQMQGERRGGKDVFAYLVAGVGLAVSVVEGIALLSKK